MPRLHLLLAEDNLPDALLVRSAIQLEQLPLEVHVSPDGERALKFFAEADANPSAPCPQVLLLDLNLPKIDGFGVLRSIRASEKHKGIPVIIMTSSDSPHDRSEAANLGAGYFRKPANYEEFLRIGPILKRLLMENGLL